MTLHSYPDDLATFTSARWPDDATPLPAPGVLLELLSTCYQASLLREEDRPVQFRALLGPPDELDALEGPPTGLQRLELTSSRSFHPEELRRLSPAVEFERGLIGVGLDDEEDLRIWGLAQSGTRWLHASEGGRERAMKLPPWLVVQVRGPGHVSVSCGSLLLGTLRDGLITPPRIDVFRSQWLSELFVDVRGELDALHEDARGDAHQPWGDLDPDFARLLAQNVLRRCVSVMGQHRHGASLLFLPPDVGDDLLGPSLSVRYEFRDDAPRKRFRTLMTRAMREMAKHGAQAGTVGWDEYVRAEQRKLVELDEALFELGHLFAALSAVDGALVLDRRLELRGFGAFVSGELTEVVRVQRALDIEAEKTKRERVLRVGTRHRAVYRICAAHSDVLGIVVSQDGNIRIVKARDGEVVCWDQDH